VKDQIYGPRLVLFAPLYVSNMCANDCTYCAFRARNKEVKRRALSQEEIRREVEILVDQGHKRILLVRASRIRTRASSTCSTRLRRSYSVKRGKGEIRRVNANIAPLTLDEFRALKGAGIGTYQLFQETYHHATYQSVHLSARRRTTTGASPPWTAPWKPGSTTWASASCSAWPIGASRSWALMQHIRHLEARFGVGPHTISVPRLEPAIGSEIASTPPHAVSDIDFRKIVAILRLAVPYTGIIMSTRETPNIRRETFALGVSQISAGSRTNPGGYAEAEANPAESTSQFQLGDHRDLDEVVRDVASMGYVPSFLYRLLPSGTHRPRLHGSGQTRCDQTALRSQRAVDLHRIPRRLRRPGNAQGG